MASEVVMTFSKLRKQLSVSQKEVIWPNCASDVRLLDALWEHRKRPCSRKTWAVCFMANGFGWESRKEGAWISPVFLCCLMNCCQCDFEFLLFHVHLFHGWFLRFTYSWKMSDWFTLLTSSTLKILKTVRLYEELKSLNKNVSRQLKPDSFCLH